MRFAVIAVLVAIASGVKLDLIKKAKQDEEGAAAAEGEAAEAPAEDAAAAEGEAPAAEPTEEEKQAEADKEK